MADFDLILITEYEDSIQYHKGEERFGEIIKSVRPEGPLFLNALRPGDFRKTLFHKTSEVLFTGDRKKRKAKL